MEILRVPARASNAIFDVSESSTSYEYSILDTIDHSVIQGTVVSDDKSQVSITMPSEYDNDYVVTVDGEDHAVTVVRPYVNPFLKASTASDIAQYVGHEEIARSIIDSIVDDGFYYKKRYLETVGIGSDYIPVWRRVNRVLKFYENNVLMYDAANPEDYPVSYELTGDKTAIMEAYNDKINRLEGAPLIFPEASSDSLDTKYIYRGFPRTFDYKILVSYGYNVIPKDVQRATELLIEDISCGRLEYYQRYITEYKTDQFQVKMNQASFSGTGNIIVDKILSNYVRSLKTPRAL